MRRFDGEFPSVIFQEIMEYLGITPIGSPAVRAVSVSHLGQKVNGTWQLRIRLPKNNGLSL